jgi:TrmH family RNA methyltransferase
LFPETDTDMTAIASTSNPRLKGLRRLQTKRGRAASGQFAAEGEDLLAAAARAGIAPLEGFRLAGTGLGAQTFADVEGPALAQASVLGSSSRVIGVYAQRWAARPSGPLCVYLHGVRDPGNVGTVLRSAAAFGASCVALGPGCADPHSPKAVRASMGAIFAVPIARADGATELPGTRIALSAAAPQTLGEVLEAAGDEITLLIGAEREGLPDALVAAAAAHARIPIATESLNAAMAATVALYETTRNQSSRVPAS